MITPPLGRSWLGGPRCGSGCLTVAAHCFAVHKRSALATAVQGVPVNNKLNESAVVQRSCASTRTALLGELGRSGEHRDIASSHAKSC